MSPDPSLAYLLGRVAALNARVRAAVERRRGNDPAADDPFRGLYLSDDYIDRLLAQPSAGPAGPVADPVLLGEVEHAADEAERNGEDVRLRRLGRDFGLTPLDIGLLLVALAPDIDARFERLYGYLNDDVSRRRASVGLALELAAGSAVAPAARHRLLTGSPLLDGGLIEVEDMDRPFLTRALIVPDRVTAHLLGDDRLDPLLASFAGVVGPSPATGSPAGETAAGLPAVLAAGGPGEDPLLAYVRERPGTGAAFVAAGALAASGRPALVLDLARLRHDADHVRLARAAGREARLRSGGLVAGPIEALAERGPGAIGELATLPCPVLLHGRSSWDPRWSPRIPLLVDAEEPGQAVRAGSWRAHLNGEAPPDLDADTLAEQFMLAPDQVSRAVESARLQSLLDGTALGVEHLRAGARAQNAAGLERLARRISPQVGWDDLVLPGVTLAQLNELTDRARHRDQVLRDWAMRPGGGRGRGVTALFAGDSGTGKTMSAEVIAGSLGLELYAVDLATVVDKYVGETEKNLERIFTEAGGVNGVLLFDEADAIFGKRSEVRDAHDRYANIESAYLLQRMESFDGLAILATNLRANLDEAFTRRLDAVVEFPMPDVSQRYELWDRCLGRSLPRADDLDLDFCARAFKLSGGNIRSIALTAGYFAAAAGRPVSMADLIRATEREYRKLGRLCLESEFGPYLGLL
ncbi:MAG: AAA family ATPase [Streptosporangiales bacterium]|nr:AAA family ATPase [Streptosporangiales bacterium]